MRTSTTPISSLCLGYGAEHVKDYFLNYSETVSNDFVLHRGEVELLGSDIRDWTITFVHTGLSSSIGERLRRVRRHAVPPQAAFHCVGVGEDERVTAVSGLRDLPLWENGGYFALRPEIFDRIPEGGCLVEDACAGPAREGRLLAHRHRGFWQPADTAEERAALEAAYHDGSRPWMLWERPYQDPLDAAAPPHPDGRRPLTSTTANGPPVHSSGGREGRSCVSTLRRP